ncbi:MAG TPA: tetratricopeptide repeat protein [Pyrinomonadaceae bacterium]|nr:tetratricopeptide repeat protein [Pyrinomonadaceae bacterium]
MLPQLAQQLKDLPNTVKGLIGFVTTLITFVILIRNNFSLGVVIFGAVLLVALFGLCVRIVTAKTISGTGFNRRESKYKYPQYRPHAFAGICLIVLAVALLFVVRSSRYYILAALAGTEVVPRADVLIAQFEARPGAKPYEIANRLKDNLEIELSKHQLGQVKVEKLAGTVKSAQEEAAAATKGSSKVVVWGWYDSEGIVIKIHTSEPTSAGDGILSMREVSLRSADAAAADLSFKLTQQLPENTSFLSLFVIGQLYYLNNDYQKGHQAFDAAMSNLPKEIRLVNESLLHFFVARRLEAAGEKDTARIVCEYTQAIEQNPKFAAAYNNLGILLAKVINAFYAMPEHQTEPPPDVELPAGSMACLKKIGYEKLHGLPETFFNKALETQPDSAAIRYNKLIVFWTPDKVASYWMRTSEIEDQEARKALEDIIKTDATIPGAHVMLGTLSFKEKDEEFDERNYQTAVNEFTAAAQLMPKSAELHVNLGKAHQRKGRLAEAAADYERALALSSGNIEAHLGLADVALRQGRAEVALKHLNAVKSDKLEEGAAVQMAAILKSRVQFQAGDIAAAIQTLRSNAEQQSAALETAEEEPEAQPQPDASREEESPYRWYVTHNDPSLSYYLSGLMHTLNSDSASAAAAWAECAPLDPNELEETDKENAYKDNDTALVVWYNLLALCKPTAADYDIAGWGVTNPCLPQNTRARLMKVFDLAQDKIAHRIYYRRPLLFAGYG